ncbi:MAG: hypothetical protein J0I93_10235 [Legionella sp.]|nr:hypothetical protein [Legionella sp.]
MMWQIPAKTFLLGEYAAIAEESALIVTTTPCFTLEFIASAHLNEQIHPNSPAGLLWRKLNHKHFSLNWNDPYQGIGGLGASSAQFLGVYLAQCSQKNQTPRLFSMLSDYYTVAWSGKGLRPSGYDVIAQAQNRCVYINKKTGTIQSYDWTFKNLSFFLVHTGNKLPTHEHLQKIALPEITPMLSACVDKAVHAMQSTDEQLFISCVNHYHELLTKFDLVTPASQKLIDALRSYPEVIGAKGCGALGADILLLLTAKSDAEAFNKKLRAEGYQVIAREDAIHTQSPLIPGHTLS